MELIGIGNTADVYVWKEGYVCKLFHKGYPENAVKREYENAKAMQNYNLPVPSCMGMVKEENRCGILYERAEGVTLLEYYQRTGDASVLLETLCSVHERILGHHADDVPDYKEFLSLFAQGKNAGKEELLGLIQSLPDGNTLCHGDFHPGNVMINKKEAEDHSDIRVIDFMNVCHGPRLYDIARTYYLIHPVEREEGKKNTDEAVQAMQAFADAYLDRMKTTKEEIAPYVEVLQKVRKLELGMADGTK